MAWTPATSATEVAGLMDKLVADVNAQIIVNSSIFEAF